nr:unnamed protein product [Digitaria exilis]
MGRWWPAALLGCAVAVAVLAAAVECAVTYDKKAVLIDGQRRILFSGSIHYPRSTPDMWEGLIQKAKDGGLDVIQTYVFWNGHEPTPGNYYFEDRYDLVRFIKTVQKAGLFVHLRIGPYICGEWNFGGFPVWLKYVPGISFRTDNEPFKVSLCMAICVCICKICPKKNDHNFVGSRNLVELSANDRSKISHLRLLDLYKKAVLLSITTCIMEEQILDALLGVPSSQQAMIMTLQLMNMVRLVREPKHSHLKELHRAVKLCEQALVSVDPAITTLGTMQEVCLAFLANYNSNSYAKVVFNNEHYSLPPWSISILPDCKNVVFNSATVGVQTSQMQMWADGASSMMWERYDEEVDSLASAPLLTTTGLLEQLNVTRDSSDYLWYITSVEISPSENFLQAGGKPLSLSVQSAGHTLHVFINGQLQGSAYGTREDRRIKYNGIANLRAGTNKIALLSVACGLPNVGVHYETWNTGVVGPVVLHGLNEGSRDLTWQTWSYQAYFETPSGDEPLALDMGSMGKGQIWINGQSIGRYHVPRSWLQPTRNLLVVFEELGGDSSKIALVKRSVSSVCADVSEDHPNIKKWQIESYGEREYHRAKVHLRCAPGQSISAIKFASFGTPMGTCGSFQQGDCHSANSHTVVEKKCIGLQKCVVAISPENFGGDPCPSVTKRVAVEAVCSPTA